MKQVYIRAHVIDTLPSGQKRVKLLANDCDGIEFYTDDESIIEDLTPTTHLISWWTERKHGHGVEHIPHCKCANCGVTYPPRIAQNIKYCAYCGARFIKDGDDGNDFD